MRLLFIATTLYTWQHYVSASDSVHKLPVLQRDLPAVIGIDLHTISGLTQPHLKARGSGPGNVEGEISNDVVSSTA